MHSTFHPICQLIWILIWALEVILSFSCQSIAHQPFDQGQARPLRLFWCPLSCIIQLMHSEISEFTPPPNPSAQITEQAVYLDPLSWASSSTSNSVIFFHRGLLGLAASASPRREIVRNANSQAPLQLILIRDSQRVGPSSVLHEASRWSWWALKLKDHLAHSSLPSSSFSLDLSFLGYVLGRHITQHSIPSQKAICDVISSEIIRHVWDVS